MGKEIDAIIFHHPLDRNLDVLVGFDLYRFGWYWVEISTQDILHGPFTTYYEAKDASKTVT